MGASEGIDIALWVVLESGDEVMQETYNIKRGFLLNAFGEMSLERFELQGAFYTFPFIKSTGLSSDVLYEKLLYEKKFTAVLGTAFGDCGEGFIRCSCAKT